MVGTQPSCLFNFVVSRLIVTCAGALLREFVNLKILEWYVGTCLNKTLRNLYNVTEKFVVWSTIFVSHIPMCAMCYVYVWSSPELDITLNITIFWQVVLNPADWTGTGPAWWIISQSRSSPVVTPVVHERYLPRDFLTLVPPRNTMLPNLNCT